MPTYIVESYAADGAVVDQCDRAARAAQAASGIRYIRTTFVPGDEVVLHLFEAGSSEALRNAVELVQLDCDRMVEVLESAEQGVTTERGPR